MAAKREEMDLGKEEEEEVVAFTKRQEKELAMTGSLPIDLAFIPFWLIVIQNFDTEGSPKTNSLALLQLTEYFLAFQTHILTKVWR